MWDLLAKIILLHIVYTIASVTSLPHVRQYRTRIINGADANQRDFKYYVSIQSNGGHLCGGAIIADQYVLTAAHCFISKGDMSPYDGLWSVRSGTTDLDGPGFENEIEYVMVLNEFVNIHSHSTTHQKDIAVVKLKDKLVLDGYYLQKINLPEEYSAWPSEGDTLTIAGFGYTEDAHISFDDNKVQVNGSTSKIMKTIETQVSDLKLCQDNHGGIEINERHICTHTPRREDDENRYGECYGDSGGPLTYGDTVFGVVSAGPVYCGERDQPTIYTRVSFYLDFIRHALNDSPTDDMVSYKKSGDDGNFYWI